MPRNPNIPQVNLKCLRYRNEHNKHEEHIKLDSEYWFKWLELENTQSFAFEGNYGYFTARKESKKRGRKYWYAYRWVAGKTKKLYLGTSDKLTIDKLNKTAVRLSNHQRLSLSLKEIRI